MIGFFVGFVVVVCDVCRLSDVDLKERMQVGK